MVLQFQECASHVLQILKFKDVRLQCSCMSSICWSNRCAKNSSGSKPNQHQKIAKCLRITFISFSAWDLFFVSLPTLHSSRILQSLVVRTRLRNIVGTKPIITDLTIVNNFCVLFQKLEAFLFTTQLFCSHSSGTKEKKKMRIQETVDNEMIEII